MRDLLSLFAEDSGESILMVDPAHIGMAALQAADPGQSPSGPGIAVLPLQGGLTPRGLSYYGRLIVPGMDNFRAAGDRAAADPNVAAIILDVNSPGGTYAGTPETANAVRRWQEAKPVIAVVDSLCASAAYFIASQAGEVVVTPSGEVGSIGVIAVHMDYSKQLEADGVTPTVIRSRPGKADANPLEPLSADARAAIEASVAEADGEFLKAVAKGRKMTVPQVRQLADTEAARTLSAKRAVELGLADRVATLSDVIAGMIKPKRPAARRSALTF